MNRRWARRTTLLTATLGVASVAGCTTATVGAPPALREADSGNVTSAELVERGRAFSRVGDLTRAAQYFAAGLASGADETEVMPLLLQVYVRSRRYRAAVARGESYLGRHPDDLRTRFLVASLHAALGDELGATRHLEQLVAADPSHASAHYALGVLLRDHQGDAAGADAHFRRYLELCPEGPYAAAARAGLLDEVR